MIRWNLGLVLLTLLACGERTPVWSWKVEIAIDAGKKLGGCAVGDLDPDSPGSEAVAVCHDGEVLLARRDGTKWVHEVIAKLPGEMIQAAIGDATASHPGNELVVVGMKAGSEDSGGEGAAHLIYKEGGSWKHVQIYEAEALIHGVCIGSPFPGLDAPAVLVTGYAMEIVILQEEAGAWTSTRAAELDGAGKHAVIYQGGAAVPCMDGSLVRVWREGDAWKNEVIARSESGWSRIGSDGVRLVVARDDGGVALVEEGKARDIYKEGMKMRGAVIGDFDPSSDGLEIATAGYERKLSLLYPAGAGWRPQALFQDTGRFHHVASGELVPEAPGPEIVTCGYSGRLVVVGRLKE
jgi:hypothetical protein